MGAEPDRNACYDLLVLSPQARAYLETTVISYLAARPSRDLRVAAHQQATSEWWMHRRHEFELYVSQLVFEEASAGDEDAVARRLELLRSVTLLDLTDECLALAERLLADGSVPKEAAEDALHIAVAAVHGMDYLLTWNCRHIANATMRVRIQGTCYEAGYDVPVICTPEELLED
ncbi:MAG: type II toxin-antitoxin system VapC family toxin [Polyangiaceae bacterium]|nr:type II toxin-antitoxin system VapC family toxin [Polyangiaceae bacterium]